ncbi:hypothetical protein ABVT39_006465 [Epinephelus coioides]
MFAYVKYVDDGCKEIVPTSYIKDFDSGCDPLKIYWVRWQDDFFKGQILLLKESREEIEEELAKGKRVRVKKVRESSPSPPPSERDEAKAQKTNQKKAAEEGKRGNLLAIIQERKIKRKQSPLCPTPTKKIREHVLHDQFSDDEDDDGGVVPQKVFEEAKKKYQKKFNEVSLQLQETQKKLEEQERIRAAVGAENDTLRALNIKLQQQLLKRLDTNSSSPGNYSGDDISLYEKCS